MQKELQINKLVKNILKTAEDIQVTLQPNVDDGIFPTKSLGFKQIADPVEKFENKKNHGN